MGTKDEDGMRSGARGRGGEGRPGARERGEAVKAEFMRGGNRKVPRKALVGAIASLVACVIVIAVVVVVLNALGITQPVNV